MRSCPFLITLITNDRDVKLQEVEREVRLRGSYLNRARAKTG